MASTPSPPERGERAGVREDARLVQTTAPNETAPAVAGAQVSSLQRGVEHQAPGAGSGRMPGPPRSSADLPVGGTAEPVPISGGGSFDVVSR